MYVIYTYVCILFLNDAHLCFFSFNLYIFIPFIWYAYFLFYIYSEFLYRVFSSRLPSHLAGFSCSIYPPQCAQVQVGPTARCTECPWWSPPPAAAHFPSPAEGTASHNVATVLGGLLCSVTHTVFLACISSLPWVGILLSVLCCSRC